MRVRSISTIAVPVVGALLTATVAWTCSMLSPLEPIWPAFLVNTVVFAAIVWCAIGGPIRLRRGLRDRRGLCRRCAYPVGPAPVCTECGAPRSGESPAPGHARPTPIVGLLVAATVTIAPAPTASADTLWDNDIEPNGIDGRATSPPQFPLHRATDDFIVPDDAPFGWVLQGLTVASAEMPEWMYGEAMEVYVYADDPATSCPDATGPVATVVGPYERREVQVTFLFVEYEYEIALPNLRLAPGTYHIGYRIPGGAGGRSTFWLTSSGGQGTERLSCWSADAGATWQSGPEAYWHLAFVLEGAVAASCVGDLDETRDVDTADLLRLLSAWGPCAKPPDPCLADLDGSGVVDTADLLTLLAVWGPCP